MLDRTERARCLELARGIALELHVAETSPLPSVHFGAATLFASLAQVEVLEDGAERAERALDRGLTLVADGATSNRLIGGLSGIGWMLRHLAGESAEPVCATIDARVEQALDVPRWEGDFDLVRGLAGYGVYALTRQHHASGRRIATRILDHLERAAEAAEVGVRWLTPASLLPDHLREEFPAGRYDLGLAHGMAGLAAVLARFVAAGVEPARSSQLLEGCVSYLLATPPVVRGRFGDALRPGQPGPIGSRMAWCYGDLGVTLALLAAARALHRTDWETEGLSVARAMAVRPPTSTPMTDPCICHGTAGLAHFFRHLHDGYPDPVFAAAAEAWLRKTFEREVGAIENYSLLAGAPGTALVLLTAATDLDSSWDEMLMFGPVTAT